MQFQPFFYDSEFDEDGESIRPLSLGFYTPCVQCEGSGSYPKLTRQVCSRCDALGGFGLYVVIKDADHSRVNDFVKENVLPYLDSVEEAKNVSVWSLCAADAGMEILRWIRNVTMPGYSPQFWANFAAYDWVLFCQLFGDMRDLPAGLPHMAFDLKQELINSGYTRKSEIPKEFESGLNLHNAYDDAIWNYRVWKWLKEGQ